MDRKLTVSQLNRYIKGVFEDELILHGVSVEGEVFEFKVSGGNSYITLSEGGCVLSCVYFSSGIPYEIGTKVCATGSVEFYPKGGRLSFVIKSIRLCGEGELAVRRKMLKNKLLAEGVFDNDRALKAMTQSIALITSGEGAVLHDFVSVLSRLAPYIDINVFPVRVQGAGAADEIIHTISDIISKFRHTMSDITCKNVKNNDITNNHMDKQFDVIVIARGGGSALDLDEFNNEKLARAIHASPITVISAVGHETDYTLCDHAADIRAGTPSIAAEIIANNNRIFFEKLMGLVHNVATKTAALLNLKNRTLLRLNEKSSLYALNAINSARRKIARLNYSLQISAQKSVSNRQKKLNDAAQKSHRLILSQYNSKESALKILCAEADKLSPLKILSKGYARLLKDKKIINSVKDIKAGDKIDVIMADGDALSSVLSIRQRN